MIKYLICGGLFIIGLILFIDGIKNRNKKIEQLIETERKKINAATHEEQERLNTTIQKQNELAREISNLQQKSSYEHERAREAKESTDRLLVAELERAKVSLKGVRELEEQRMKQEFQERERVLMQQLESKKQQLTEDFENTQNLYKEELGVLKLELDEYRAKREAVNEAILRERELEEKEDFYRIIIKDSDVRDIEVLHSIESHLCNREILNKLIFEAFIKRPLTEMEKRVIKGRKIGGIYKITYIKTGESYIGRSVDIGNRWKEHCLSSLNIGSIAHSTFHNILAEKGLQNFTWEVLEEVEKEKQSSREKYWIDFYHTDKQYNQRLG